nr:Hsp70 family protein [Chloroflexia bacterium]
MNPAPPFLGIDFGTFKSCMAWVPPGSDTAEIIKNAEGDDMTASVLYYGADAEPLVGEAAEDMAGDEVEWERVVTGIKRDLLRAAPLWIDRRRIDPVDAVAAILAKLKVDAERGVFRGKPVTRAVITHPALFDALQRDKLATAARRAGFDDVELLEEPVAAALAYERWLRQIGEPVTPGDHILVYDFGGGTFDLAVLAREDDGSFREAMEPEGLHQRGGNDLDLA